MYRRGYPGGLFFLARLVGDVVDAVDGLVQLGAAVPAAQRVAQRGRVVHAARAALRLRARAGPHPARATRRAHGQDHRGPALAAHQTCTVKRSSR